MRPAENPTELLITEALSLSSKSPLVLKTYMYMTHLAANNSILHLNIMPDNVARVVDN